MSAVAILVCMLEPYGHVSPQVADVIAMMGCLRRCQLGFHVLLSYTHDTYASTFSVGPVFSGSRASSGWKEGEMMVPVSAIPRNMSDPNRRKANAAFVVLGEGECRIGVDTERGSDSRNC